MRDGDPAVLIATPANAPFIVGSAADPEVHSGSAVGITIDNLLAELADPSAPLVTKTLASLDGARGPATQGVAALTIGYMSRYQSALAAGSDRPVVSSPLLAMPMLLATLRADQRVLVIYARSTVAIPEDMPGVSAADYAARVLIVGLEGPGAFRRAVIERTEPFAHSAVLSQIIDVVAGVQKRELISAVVLECGEMAAVANELRSALSIPVVDYHSVIHFFSSSLGNNT